MRSICHALFVILWLALLATSGVSAQTIIPRSVIGSGGGPASNGAVFLNGTIGQPIIGTVSGPLVLQQGFWFAMPTTPGPTGVFEGHTTERGLVRVFPNPVSTGATVSIELASPGHLKAVLFDRLGRHLTTLVDEQRTAGTHSLSLDAAALPSGSYLLHVHIAGRLETIPVAIVR